ncbi:MAG: protein kinase [Vulcanimicrobiota bacterium]
MPRCLECGVENTDNARFCSRCGMSLAAAGTSRLTLLGTRYEVLSTIKSGAMGCVYKAWDTRLNNIVALKKMKSSHQDLEEIRYAEERFREEASLLSRLHHGGLPKVIDFFSEVDPEENRPVHYLVMTYIEGADLETVITARNARPFDVNEVLSYSRQILQILKYLHSEKPPVVYRDLNPRNVMLSEVKIFLVDFGIARVFRPQQQGTAIGTPGYTAPEQYKGFAEPRSDIYSLGAVMHYLLTAVNPEGRSQPLFSFTPIRKVNPDVPEYLERIIMSMVDVIPERRPSSAAEAERLLDSQCKRTPFPSAAGLAPHSDIFQAVRSGDSLAIRDFIKAGADVNRCDDAGLAPLHVAALCGQKEAARILISEGADINIQNPLGHTPLKYAREKGYLEIAGLLCAHGVREKADSAGGTGSASRSTGGTASASRAVSRQLQKKKLERLLTAAVSAVLSLSLICVGLFLYSGQRHFQSLMKEAHSAASFKNYVAAAEYAGEALSLYPDDPTARMMLIQYSLYGAQKLLDQKDYTGCRESLTRLFARDSGNAEGKRLEALLNRKMRIEKCLSMGDHFFESREFSKARAEYEEALKLEPDNLFLKDKIAGISSGEKFLALLNTSGKLLQQKEFTSARKTVEEALGIFPYDEEARHLRIKIETAAAFDLLAKKEFRKAYDMASATITETPVTSEAIEVHSRARKAWMEACYSEGKRLFGLNKLDHARRHFRTVLDLDPRDIDAKRFITEIDDKVDMVVSNWKCGKAFYRNGEYEQAIKCFETSLSVDKDNHEIKKALLDAYLKREEELRARRLRHSSGPTGL